MPQRTDSPNAFAAYQSGNLSLDDFEDWFRTNARGMFGENQDVLDACLSVENAFVEVRENVITKEEFRRELAAAIRPLLPIHSHASQQNAVIDDKVETLLP